MLNNVKRKAFFYPLSSLSFSSSNNDNCDRHKCLLKIDMLKFHGHMNIDGFLDWLVEVERFFQHTKIAQAKKVKLVARKLKGSAWAWWKQIQRMHTQLKVGKDEEVSQKAVFAVYLLGDIISML